MAARKTPSLLALALLFALFATPSSSSAQVAIGLHGGINLDHANLHLGADVLVMLAELSPNVALGIWPSYAHVFIDDTDDVELFGVDFPFLFDLDDAAVTPYFAPGLGLAFQNDDSFLKVNLIGGVFFDVSDSVRPFVELAVRLVNGTYVDLLAGLLFEL
jgi:hypothetical protein